MHKRAQSAVEFALVAPLLLLLLGGVADVGRAFYYKIAVSNAAREAAHWATLQDPLARRPPNDEQIGIDVTQPSQEAFGLGMSLAPLCSVGLQTDNCNTVTIRHAAPPISGTFVDTLPMDTTLQPGSSWLFIYPNQSARTALLTAPAGVAWHVVNERSQVVSAPDPQHGGVDAALAAAQHAERVIAQLNPSMPRTHGDSFVHVDRIDLAVEDPRRRGRVLVAVETDGPAYAAMSSTRDRDRLRIEQLRRLGWEHVRVWTTDLFRDPARDVARVSAAVRSASAAYQSDTKPADTNQADPKRHVAPSRSKPEQSRDDTDAGWGERPSEDSQDQWLRDQRPPHWG